MNHESPLAAFNPEAFALRSKHSLSLTVGHRPDGYPIDVPLTLINGEARHPRVLLVAGVHGDEFEGVRALMKLGAALTPAEVLGTVLIAPIANTPAYNVGSRNSSIDHLNLNRLFPGNPEGSFSERLAFQLFEHLVKKADLLVDLHSAGSRMEHGPLAGFYDMPGALGAASLRAARAMDMPYIWRLPLRPGVLTYEAIRAGIVAVGAELGGGGRCLPVHVSRYQLAVQNILQTWGVLFGKPAFTAEPKVVLGDWILAPTAGYLESSVALEQWVAEGTIIATIYGADSSVQAQLKSPRDGWVLGLRTFPAVYTGDPAIFVLQEGEEASTPAKVY